MKRHIGAIKLVAMMMLFCNVFLYVMILQHSNKIYKILTDCSTNIAFKYMLYGLTLQLVSHRTRVQKYFPILNVKPDFIKPPNLECGSMLA